MRRFARLAAALMVSALAALTLVGWDSEAPRWNVVLVVVDTLSAERLSLYGYERETSPAFDRIAAERGIVFRNGWSNSGCTYPSVSSLLTGRWPQRILAHHGRYGMNIPDEFPTLAARLAEQGWTTAAVSTSLAQPRAGREANRRMFSPGFATYDNRCMGGSADCVNGVAREKLDRLPEPFFLYLHYFDPHAAYRPPDDHIRRFALESGRSHNAEIELGDPTPVKTDLYDRRQRLDPDAEFVRRLSDLYDEEVHYLDSALDELFSELENQGLLERSIVVLAADHGEELHENGEWGHCRSLALDSVLRTPMVYFVPDLRPGMRDTPASNVDILPTLFGLLELPLEPESYDGGSLRAVLERGDRAATERTVFAAQGVIRLAASADHVARFNVERRDWAGERARAGEAPGQPPLAPEEARLRLALIDWVRSVEGDALEGRAAREAHELEEELKSIGYL